MKPHTYVTLNLALVAISMMGIIGSVTGALDPSIGPALAVVCAILVVGLAVALERRGLT